MMQPILRAQLLGDFSLLYGDQAITGFNSTRLQSLLAYLMLHGDAPQQRHYLASLFWPDMIESQARNNLRQLVHQLRQALPEIDRFLQADTNQLCWHTSSFFRFDVAEYEDALRQAVRRNEVAARRDALLKADGLYHGPLLPSCYDEWILPVREQLHQSHLQVIEQLIGLFETQGDIVSAITYAQRSLRADPISEDRARRLMRLHALNNDRASALRVYHAYVTTLQRELGVEPDSTTRAAYERLLHQDSAVVQIAPVQPTFIATPALIGRRREQEALHDAWQRVVNGGPQFVLVTGEAGIGKSRLAEEFLSWAGQQGVVTAKTRSYAAEGQLSLAPVTEWLRSDGLRSSLDRLDTIWLTEVARILPELLAERPDVPRYEPVTEYGQRQRFFEALARATLATPQPLALLIDDLHWCDQETLEWLHFLLRFDQAARLLVIGCARTEELPPQHPLRTLILHLSNSTQVIEMSLQPLDAAETGKLAAQVTNRQWDVDALMRLYRETEGYPLFVVEFVRAGMEPTTASEHKTRAQLLPDDAPALPSRVQAVLVNRLLQLSAPARACAELAATIGREFSLDLLVAAGNADADSTVRSLDELWHRRIVREQEVNHYDFTHDKLREVAYAEISVPQRRMLHRRVAQAMQALHAEDLDSISGQLASHYEHAGMIEQAILANQRAASVAQHMYANEDAISLLQRGLGLLERLPAGLKRDRQELDLHLALAPLYRVTKGWAAPEMERVLDRALALCDIIGDDVQRAEVLYGLQSLYVVQARLERVQSVSDELQTLYLRSRGTPPPPFANMMLAGMEMHLGKLAEANERFEQIFATYDPDQLLHLQESQGVNYAALARAWQAHALWCLGYSQQALERGLEAIRLVQDLDQPFNQSLVSTYMAMLQQLRAEDAVAKEHAEEALALTGTYQAPYYRAWAAILTSYAQASEHPDKQHIKRLRGAIAEFKAAGARLRLPYYLSLLARIYEKAGYVVEGLAVIDEALAEARSHNERWWDAELHRQRGDLLLMHGTDADDVEAALLRAVEIARSQQAKSLELRATTSLARFWITQRRSTDAQHRLGEVYAWFTEGFDTPDLQSAQNLLARL